MAGAMSLQFVSCPPFDIGEERECIDNRKTHPPKDEALPPTDTADRRLSLSQDLLVA